MFKEMLKNWRVLLWILILIGAFFAIGLNFAPHGFLITSKTVDSPLTTLVTGDAIYMINGQDATTDMLAQDYFGLVHIGTSKGEKFVQINGTLGITTKPVPNSNLKFGLDIEGGIRAMLLLNQSDNLTVEQTISTLQTRINLYGLREATLRAVSSEQQTFVEVSIAGGEPHEITDLLQRQGAFESKIPIIVKLTNNAGSFAFTVQHSVAVVDNDTVKIDDSNLDVGQSVMVDNVNITLADMQPSFVNLTALAFSGPDITLVYFDPQHASIQQTQSGGYEWQFQVRLSQEAAERFAAITKNLDAVFSSSAGQSYLSSKIYLYLDNELVDELNIVSDLKGKVIQEPSVTGGAQTQEEASKSQKRLQTILRSGALPTRIELASMEVLSPRLGQAFIANIMLALLGAMVAVAIVVTVRYRRLKIIVPMVITSMSEVLILFGASVMIGWTIDLASVAGILAIVGTGVDAQIILIDQTLRGGEEQITMKERVKRALFMIFGAGGTSIGAMLPLMILGFGLLRGFALTTIIGVIVGIFIARPAFGEIIKLLMQGKQTTV
jgi:preprotein translocase subunit SecD